MASTMVRMTLLNTSCAVRLQPEVLRMGAQGEDLGFLAPRSLISRVHRRRAARNFATSMKKFMPMAQKKERRGAKASMGRPALAPARTYSTPSASV